MGVNLEKAVVIKGKRQPIGNCATALKESKGEDKREVDVIMKLCYSLS